VKSISGRWFPEQVCSPWTKPSTPVHRIHPTSTFEDEDEDDYETIMKPLAQLCTKKICLDQVSKPD
jgi:hypothetical protein